MATKLIELEDGVLVEVEVPPDQEQKISGDLAEKVDATFQKIQPVFRKICQPLILAWKEIDQDAEVKGAEIEIGLSFETEGNLYVTRSKAGANITIKLILQPKALKKD